MRTFIALPLPISDSRLPEAVTSCRNRLAGEKIAWVDLRNVHITLFFLGETDSAITESLCRELETIASSYNPFLLQVKGLGYFGSRSSPRVLWAGISEQDTILHLQKDIENAVTHYGFKAEERAFHPHVTVARLKYIQRPEKLHEILSEYRSAFFQEALVDQIVWMESILTYTGAVYKPFRKFHLRRN